MTNNIRYTLENNSYLQTKDWTGKGQPTLAKVPATQWRVIINDPSKHECSDIKSFNNKEDAQAFINKQKNS